MSDPFKRPLDRHLHAQRLAFGSEAYRPNSDRLDRWHVTCPRCVTQWRRAVVTEHGEGGAITIVCLDGCPPEKVASSAESLEEFFVDGQDTPLLPLRPSPVEGWVVRVPLDEYADLLEAAA